MRAAGTRGLWALALGAALLGCAGPPGTPLPDAGDSAPTTRPSNRTLVMIARAEPPTLAAKSLQPVIGALDQPTPLFNALLDLIDERGEAHPYLADDLPRLNTASWQVHPDSRMETSYRLRPGLMWHDGTPLSAEDFVFGWHVYAAPALGASSSPPIGLMEEVVAPDPQTLTIRWRQMYPYAGTLNRGFQALPRQLLEDTFQQLDAQHFAGHPFWTRDYVGLGPYRLSQWDPGAFLEGTGFEGHALGRPKIDRVRVTIVGDQNTALTVLLSGEAHFSLDVAISQEEAAILEREWGARHGGTVLYSPSSARIIQMQHRPDFASPRELLDVRMRRALAHAIDKQGLNDVLQHGRAIITDSLTPPTAPYAPLVASAISTYPLDLRRGQQLLADIGLTRGADAFFAASDGRPLQLEVLHLSGPANERENSLLVDSIKRLQINAIPTVLPLAQASDVQSRALAPGLLPPHPTAGEQALGNYSTRSIPSPETRWLGPNYGGWSSLEFDQRWEAFTTLLDGPQRIQQIVQMERVYSEDVGGIPYYYMVGVNAYVEGLEGPMARVGPEAGFALAQVYRWDWR